MISKTQLESYYTSLSTNNSTENTALGLALMNQEQRYILEKYFSNETSSIQMTVANQQDYKLPQNYSKMKDVTITVGTITYTLKEVLTRVEWDVLNMYKWTAEIPWYYFIYDGKVKIFPVPSGDNNIITYNYKLRVTDLSIPDTSAGTITITVGAVATFNEKTGGTGYVNATNVPTTGGTGTGATVDIVTFQGAVTGIVIHTPGINYTKGDILTITTGGADATFQLLTVTGSNTITGSGTSWSPTVGINETRWIQMPFPTGDNQWYQIASVDSATQITLYNSYQGTTPLSGAPYTMGQMPILMEDFHPMMYYSALIQYYSSGINKNIDIATKWQDLYDRGIVRLDAYAGSKSTGVGLEGDIPLLNPNLFYSGQ